MTSMNRNFRSINVRLDDLDQSVQDVKDAVDRIESIVEFEMSGLSQITELDGKYDEYNRLLSLAQDHWTNSTHDYLYTAVSSYLQLNVDDLRSTTHTIFAPDHVFQYVESAENCLEKFALYQRYMTGKFELSTMVIHNWMEIEQGFGPGADDAATDLVNTIIDYQCHIDEHRVPVTAADHVACLAHLGSDAEPHGEVFSHPRHGRPSQFQEAL
jgi:hypothetical protein